MLYHSPLGVVDYCGSLCGTRWWVCVRHRVRNCLKSGEVAS